jgi:hypothetical protein
LPPMNWFKFWLSVFQSKSGTLMQLSFNRGTRVEKTLMQTLTSQLSCNSCSRLTGAQELRKLSCKLSLLNSHQLSCNSCSRLTGARELKKLSYKLSLLNSHQLSCNSCSRLTGTRELKKLSANSRFSTLTFVWPRIYDTWITVLSHRVIIYRGLTSGEGFPVHQ